MDGVVVKLHENDPTRASEEADSLTAPDMQEPVRRWNWPVAIAFMLIISAVMWIGIYMLLLS